MPYEIIADPIDVLAVFADGKITPRRFRWNGRSYDVACVHRHWVYREGGLVEHHFAVSVDCHDQMELCLRCPAMTWTLERVSLP